MMLHVPVRQFSGQNADDMRKTYAEFCSRQLKAVKLYKELLTRDKKFHSFIRVRNQNSPVSSSICVDYMFYRIYTVKLSTPDPSNALCLRNIIS